MGTRLATSSLGCGQHTGHIVLSVLSLPSSLPCLLLLPLPSRSQYCSIYPRPIPTRALWDSLKRWREFSINKSSTVTFAQLYILYRLRFNRRFEHGWERRLRSVYFSKLSKRSKLICSSIIGSQEINQCGVPGPPCQSKQERANCGHARRLQRLHHLAHW